MLKHIKKSKTVDTPTKVSLEEHHKFLHKKYPHKLKSVAPFILATEACERLSYYSLVTNLALYGSKLGLSSSTSSVLTSLFASYSYLSALSGAYLADTKYGRYKTIAGMCMLYIVGLLLVSVSAYPEFLESDPTTSALLFYFGVFVCIGTAAGGIKANVSTLGADQFDPESTTYAQDKDSFFMFFYWSINGGALIATGLLTNLAMTGIPPAIPASYGFFFVYCIATLAFCAAIAIFIYGSNRYVKNQADGSVMTDTLAIVYAGAKKSLNGKLTIFAVCALLLTLLMSFVSVGVTGEGKAVFTYTQAILYLSSVVVILFIGKDVDWVYDANGFPTEMIEGTAAAIRLLPMVVFMSLFFMVYNLQNTLFIYQGCQMDTFLFGGTQQVAPSAFSLIDVASVVVMIPLCDRVFFPLWEKITGSYPSRFGRVGCGLFLAALSVTLAGVLEVFRKDAGVLTPLTRSICYENQPIYVGATSLWWQTPQYFLIGLGEVLACVTAFDIFYSHVPSNLRSMSSSLNLLSVCFGSLLCSVVIEICTSAGWIPEGDINEGHLEYCFFLMGGLGFMVLAIYIPYVNNFELWEDLSMVVVEDVPNVKSPSEQPRPITAITCMGDGAVAAVTGKEQPQQQQEHQKQEEEEEFVKRATGVAPSDLIHDPAFPDFSRTSPRRGEVSPRASPRSSKKVATPRSLVKLVQLTDLHFVSGSKDEMYLVKHNQKSPGTNATEQQVKSPVCVEGVEVHV